MKTICFILAILAAVSTQVAADQQEKEDRALFASLKGLYRSVGDEAPERYAVELLSTKFWHTLDFARLSGTCPGTPEELDSARKRLSSIKKDIETGRAWKLKPPKFEMPRFSSPPALDGEMKANEWQNALILNGNFRLSETAPYPPNTKWMLGYDQYAIYVCLLTTENPLATYQYGQVSGKAPWDGAAMEVFILPDKRLPCYREVVANLLGTVFTALHSKRSSEIAINGKAENAAIIPCAAKRLTKSGWCAEMAIPFKELPGYFRGNPPQPGETLFIGLIRTHDGCFYSPYPLLYNGHNIYGYAAFTLK